MVLLHLGSGYNCIMIISAAIHVITNWLSPNNNDPDFNAVNNWFMKYKLVLSVTHKNLIFYALYNKVTK